jgi:hypothetical protein
VAKKDKINIDLTQVGNVYHSNQNKNQYLLKDSVPSLAQNYLLILTTVNSSGQVLASNIPSMTGVWN